MCNCIDCGHEDEMEEMHWTPKGPLCQDCWEELWGISVLEDEEGETVIVMDMSNT